MYSLKHLSRFSQYARLCYAIKSFKRYESNDFNIIESKSSKITIPDQLISEYVWKNCDKWHDKTALICFETGRNYTFEELRIKSNNLANNLRNNLQINNETVAIILPNIPEFVISFLGVLEAGLLITPVNPFYTIDEILRQLENSGATIIFTVIELCTIIKQSVLNKNFTIIVIDVKQNETIPEGFLRFTDLISGNFNGISVNSRPSPDEIAILPYSSGTTGLTKGVQLTHKNIVANLSQMSSPDFRINYETQNNFQDVVPVFLPLFHIYGLVVVFLNFLSQGCKLITIPKFIPSQFGRLLKTYQPTLIFAVPQFINSILINSKLKYDDLKCIRTIASAAAPLGIDAVTNFNRKTHGQINLLQMYGMTETSPLILMQTINLENGKKIGGSGFLIPNTQAKILPLDNNSNIGLNPYEIGELVVKGPQIMQGYHKNAEATNTVFVDGWLRTGDVGYYDTDQHFFITDRLKELIKVKGFQVAPAELEEVLLKHPSVYDCAVIGIPHRVQGEAPKAFIVLKPNQTTKPEELKEYVANRVANYKRLIGGCVIVDKIPRNCAGKVLRRQLRQL